MGWQRTGPTKGWLWRIGCVLFWHRFDVRKMAGPWIKMRGGEWAHKVRCERCGILLLLWPAVMRPGDEHGRGR